MRNFLKNIKSLLISKDLIIDLFFGLLILICWNGLGSDIRMIIATLDGNMAKVLDVSSANWCEHSAYTMVKCHKYRAYFIELSIVLAALLYSKHKKWAFLCLILLPLLLDLILF